MPGRELLLHSCGPKDGFPGHITTNPGRFWLTVPRPYRSHDPMLGRTGWVSPQVIINSDGSWLGKLVCIDRITHRSSAWRAMWGKISLISSPLLPCLANLNGDCMRLPVPRSVFSPAAGGFWPLYFASAGFGSKGST